MVEPCSTWNRTKETNGERLAARRTIPLFYLFFFLRCFSGLFSLDFFFIILAWFYIDVFSFFLLLSSTPRSILYVDTTIGHGSCNSPNHRV